MQTKTKTIVAISTIFILTIVAGILYGIRSATVDTFNGEILLNQDDAKNKQGIVVKQTKEKQVTSTSKQLTMELATQVSSGIVTGIGKDTVDVKIEKENKTLKVDEKTSFYEMQNGKIVARSLADLNIGSKIVFEYEEKNNHSISIKLIQ